jgi:hypothetical protein
VKGAFDSLAFHAGVFQAPNGAQQARDSKLAVQRYKLSLKAKA